MKKTYLLLTAIILSSFMFSCDEDDDRHVFNEATTTYFEEVSFAINAVDDENTTTEITIVSTDVSETARQYSLVLDPASTAVSGVDFMAPATITIPAGSYSGTATITSILTGNTVDGATAILGLADSGEVAVFDNAVTIDILHSTCELFPENPFTGMYLLEQVAGDNSFGPAFVSTGTEVMVSVDPMDSTVRSFESVYLVAVGQPAMTFSFALNCGQAVPLDGQNPLITCGGEILLSSSEALIQNYNPFDDSEILVTFIEEIPAGCTAATTSETTIKLTKM